MKVFNQTAALRIAIIGASKMNDETHTLFAPIFDVDPNTWHVARNDDSDTTYRIEFQNDGTYTCNCPFYEENEEYGACKHGEYVKIEKAEQARADEMSEKLSDPDYIAYAVGNGFLPR